MPPALAAATAGGAGAAQALWRTLLDGACHAAQAIRSATQAAGLPTPSPAGLVFSNLVLATAALALLCWNVPYAYLYHVQGRSLFDRYLIQPAAKLSPAALSRRRADYLRALWVMASSLALLWLLLAGCGGGAAILYFREDWRAALDAYYGSRNSAGGKGIGGGSGAAAAAAAALALPSLGRLVVDLIACQVVEDFAFYFLHRLIHHPRLYAASGHKRHHEFKAPFSLCSTYASAFDFVFADSVPLTLAVIVVASSTSSAMACIAYRLYLTTEIHSGYAFPWAFDNLLRRLTGGRDFLYAGSRHHDAHHERTHGNYSSSLVFWDWALGTMLPERRGDKGKAA